MGVYSRSLLSLTVIGARLCLTGLNDVQSPSRAEARPRRCSRTAEPDDRSPPGRVRGLHPQLPRCSLELLPLKQIFASRGREDSGSNWSFLVTLAALHQYCFSLDRYELGLSLDLQLIFCIHLLNAEGRRERAGWR